MPLNWNQAWAEAVASVDTTVAFIDTVEISCDSFSTYRYAVADSDLEINGNLYIGKKFSCDLPQLKSQSNGGMDIKISNVKKDIVINLDKALSQFKKINVLYAQYLAGTSGYAKFIVPLQVTSIDTDKSDLIVHASYINTSNKKVPSKMYTAKEHPGLRP